MGGCSYFLSSLFFLLLFVQLNFFRKGLKSLEAVEQHLRVVAARQHIDYQFSGLEDDDGEDDGEKGYDASEGGELSFDYRQNKRGVEVVSATRNSMDVRNLEICFLVNSYHYFAAFLNID